MLFPLTVAAFLYRTELHNAVFYTFSLLLEQGDANLNNQSCSVRAVVLIWIFVGLILRLAYSSDMYSHLTVEQKITVPQSFNDCVNDENFYKFAEHGVVTSVFNKISLHLNTEVRKYEISNSTNKLLKLLSKQIKSVSLFKGLTEETGELQDFKYDLVPTHQIKD